MSFLDKVKFPAFKGKVEEPIPEIQIALFGQSGSGKTTFLASYFGNQQRHSFEKTKGYALEAQDISTGSKLISEYYRMEEGSFPMGTESFSEYRFNLKISGIHKPGLQVVWYDYPGGWWERTPFDKSEAQERKLSLKKIVSSDVGIVMIDASKYLRNGMSYIQALFDSFRNEIRRLKDSIPSGEEMKLPSEWMIVISKSDMLPAEKRAEDLSKEIISHAFEQFNGIGEALGSKSFGKQFLLVSSALADKNKVIDAHKFIGLQLIAPLSLMMMLNNLVQIEKSKNNLKIYRAGAVTFGTLSFAFDFFDHLSNFLPLSYKALFEILKKLSVKEGLDKGVDHFKKKQLEAAKNGNLMDAVVAAMQAELVSPEAEHAFFRNQWN